MEWWSNGLVQHSITPTLHYSILLRTSAPRIAEVATAFQIVCYPMLETTPKPVLLSRMKERFFSLLDEFSVLG